MLLLVNRAAPPPPLTASRPGLPVAGPVFEAKEDHGARGDGASNDTTALQQAIDAAVAAGGGTVRIGAGTYMISRGLTYGSNIALEGEGPERTIIRNTLSRKRGTFMLIPKRDGLANVVVRDLTFDQRGDWYDRDGESRHEFLLDVRATTNMAIYNCWFRRVRTVAVYSDTTSSSTTVGLRVVGNHVFEANGGGFSWFGSFRDFVIEDNVIEHTKDDAIAVQDKVTGEYPTSINITNNKILNCKTRTYYGSTPNGINNFGGDRVTISGNTIANVLANGIRVGSGASRRGTYTRVSNNVISGAGSNNATTDVPDYGISVIGADHVYLNDNTITNSRGPDYNVQQSRDVQGAPTG
jgi:hypothetical protein